MALAAAKWQFSRERGYVLADLLSFANATHADDCARRTKPWKRAERLGVDWPAEDRAGMRNDGVKCTCGMFAEIERLAALRDSEVR